jgi:hypothetical protein
MDLSFNKGVFMKKSTVLIFGCVWIFLAGVCAAQAPHEIAGFSLGKNIDEYRDAVNSASDMPIRHRGSIREVQVKPVAGYKSGIVSYGTCVEKGRVLRIRLKYLDASKKFYETLLSRFKERFGEPSEWRGDPFHIVINWKWSFTDKDGNRISLQLQHNTKDVEEKIGNTVKLSLPEAIHAEHICLDKKTQVSKGGQKPSSGTPPDWDLLIPR